MKNYLFVSKKKQNQAYTIVELMVAVVIGLTLFAGVALYAFRSAKKLQLEEMKTNVITKDNLARQRVIPDLQALTPLTGFMKMRPVVFRDSLPGTDPNDNLNLWLESHGEVPGEAYLKCYDLASTETNCGSTDRAELQFILPTGSDDISVQRKQFFIYSLGKLTHYFVSSSVGKNLLNQKAATTTDVAATCTFGPCIKIQIDRAPVDAITGTPLPPLTSSVYMAEFKGRVLQTHGAELIRYELRNNVVVRSRYVDTEFTNSAKLISTDPVATQASSLNFFYNFAKTDDTSTVILPSSLLPPLELRHAKDPAYLSASGCTGANCVAFTNVTNITSSIKYNAGDIGDDLKIDPSTGFETAGGHLFYNSRFSKLSGLRSNTQGDSYSPSGTPVALTPEPLPTGANCEGDPVWARCRPLCASLFLPTTPVAGRDYDNPNSPYWKEYGKPVDWDNFNGSDVSWQDIPNYTARKTGDTEYDQFETFTATNLVWSNSTVAAPSDYCAASQHLGQIYAEYWNTCEASNPGYTTVPVPNTTPNLIVDGMNFHTTSQFTDSSGKILSAGIVYTNDAGGNPTVAHNNSPGVDQIENAGANAQWLQDSTSTAIHPSAAAGTCAAKKYKVWTAVNYAMDSLVRYSRCHEAEALGRGLANSSTDPTTMFDPSGIPYSMPSIVWWRSKWNPTMYFPSGVTKKRIRCRSNGTMSGPGGFDPGTPTTVATGGGNGGGTTSGVSQ